MIPYCAHFTTQARVSEDTGCDARRANEERRRSVIDEDIGKVCSKTLYRPDLLYHRGRFRRDAGLLVGENGRVTEIVDAPQTSECKIVCLPGKALLPGFINAHSHSFQRLIRGRAESRRVSGPDFWSWRETMYQAAADLDPEGVYDVARMAFLEMALAGTTTVGEFHYLHNAPDGRPYDDPNLLSRKIIDAARSVGLRVVLLRGAYQRSGYEVPANRGQIRFFESTGTFLENVASLLAEFPADSEGVRIGVAPHSIRAVPLEDLCEIVFWGRERKLPIHMHVAEQLGEVLACKREYGYSPLELLERQNLIDSNFTAVHAIHMSIEEIGLLAAAKGTICSCPTAERNLGDGVLAADEVARRRIPIALGSDSHSQIDPLEDARGLDYHLRLTRRQRVILDEIHDQELSARLFECATTSGAKSLMIPGGELKVGFPADFFTVDLSDPCIAGNSPDDLLSLIVFSLTRSAISEVAVGGRLLVRDHSHSEQEEIISRYLKTYQRVWLKEGLPIQ